VLIVTLHRCTACGESTVVSKIILDAPESCFGRFGDGVVSVQDRCSVCAKRTIVDPMVLLGDEAQLEARFVPFGDSANLDVR
jgi:rRNA maturation protein Nop10